MVIPLVYTDTPGWASPVSPCTLLPCHATLNVRTAFRTVNIKDEAILLQLVRAHSKNSSSSQQKGSQPMCQRNRETHKRKFILGGLLERRLFSFLCIYWVERFYTKHRFCMSAERSHQRTVWKKHGNKTAAFKPTLAGAIVCSDCLFSCQSIRVTLVEVPTNVTPPYCLQSY